MELHQLEYLVAVADEGSFTKAAARMHVAQPGVSAQVRRLERELGHELLDRSGRSVRTTSAGQVILPLARSALSTIREIHTIAAELSGVMRGHVAVGMMTSCPPGVITDALARFHREHPGVGVTLIEAPTAELVIGLHNATIDLAVIGFSSPPDGLHVEVINDDVLVAAVAADHPLAQRKSLSLHTLVEHELICLPRGAGIRAMLDEGCAAVGLKAPVTLEASNPEVVADLAAHRLGVAVLPESYARMRNDLRLIRIGPPKLRGGVGVVWRADSPLSSAASALLRQWRLPRRPASTNVIRQGRGIRAARDQAG